MMISNYKKTISQFVTEDYRTAEVFNNYKIDFCCNGKKPLEDVCRDKNLNADVLLNELESVKKNKLQETVNYDTWPLDLLADYIEKKHHRYVEKKLPEITAYLNKVVDAHSKNHIELIDVQRMFGESAGELTMHMRREELILFPFIRTLSAAKENNNKVSAPHFGTVSNPIQMMMAEHSNEGERFKSIESITNNFTPPADACNTYRVMLALLKEFQDDLHLHIHLENNILFPKSIELENELVINN